MDSLAQWFEQWYMCMPPLTRTIVSMLICVYMVFGLMLVIGWFDKKVPPPKSRLVKAICYSSAFFISCLVVYAIYNGISCAIGG
jgi:hypothetical protein